MAYLAENKDQFEIDAPGSSIMYGLERQNLRQINLRTHHVLIRHPSIGQELVELLILHRTWICSTISPVPH